MHGAKHGNLKICFALPPWIILADFPRWATRLFSKPEPGVNCGLSLACNDSSLAGFTTAGSTFLTCNFTPTTPIRPHREPPCGDKRQKLPGATQVLSSRFLSPSGPLQGYPPACVPTDRRAQRILNTQSSPSRTTFFSFSPRLRYFGSLPDHRSRIVCRPLDLLFHSNLLEPPSLCTKRIFPSRKKCNLHTRIFTLE